MKKSLVLAMAMALGVTASAYAANPFSDVPAGHWAYDSIDKLAAAGVIEGMGDGTYQGDRNMTRYEMAQIVAKAMAKGANVDKLAAEFADELDNLGVRVAALEKKADNVKITGNIRYVYATKRAEGGTNRAENNTLRTRLTLKGQINDSWSYTALLQNVQDFTPAFDGGEEGVRFQRAYLNGRIGGLKVTAGRYSMEDVTGGNIYSHRFDGAEATYGKKLAVTVGQGKASTRGGGATVYGVEEKADATKSDEVWYASAKLALAKGANIHGGYYKFKDLNGGADDVIHTFGVAGNLSKSLNLTADYLKASANAAKSQDGFVIGLNYKGAKAAQVGSFGLTAKYYDQDRNTIVSHEWNAYDPTGDVKGYKLGGYYTVAKNMVAGVEWFDLKNKDTDNKVQTMWTQMIMTF